MTGFCSRLNTFLDHLGDGDYVTLDSLDGNCTACETCSHACHQPATTPLVASGAPEGTGLSAGGTHLDLDAAETAEGKIERALALHPKTMRTAAPGDHRTICGLCRDPWPCATVAVLS